MASDKKHSKGSSGSRSHRPAGSSSNRSNFYGDSGNQPHHNSYSIDTYADSHSSTDHYVRYVNEHGNTVGGRGQRSERDAQRDAARYLDDFDKQYKKKHDKK